MTEIRTNPPSPGMTLGDLYYVLFRHKWKIVIGAAAGLIAAAALSMTAPRLYQSEAKLLIRYVLESRTPNQISPNAPGVKSPDERGENIINTELEILNSLDLAQQVAEAVGPEKILGKGAASAGGAPAAAGVIRKGLQLEVPKNSSVIRIVFQHSDPNVVQPVLSHLIDLYLKRHNEIHHAPGVFDEFLTKETDESHSRLAQIEDALRRAKTNVHIISLEDSKKAYTEQMSRLQQAIFEAEAELTERQATIKEMHRLLEGEGPSTNSNEVAAQTNAAPVPADQLAEYKRLSVLLESLGRHEQELLLQFTPETSLVKGVRAQIADNERQRQKLEAQYPGLVLKAAESRPGSSSRNDLAVETARVAALQSKLSVLTNQLARIINQASAVDEVEGSIADWQRKKELEEANYKYFSGNLQQSKVNDGLGASHVSNINTIQAPSPPGRAPSKINKAVAAAAVGGLGLALALAFLIELYFDRSIKRPGEIESRLGLPLFITIPKMANGKPLALPLPAPVPLLSNGDSRPSSEPAAAAETIDTGAPDATAPESDGEHRAPVTADHAEPAGAAANGNGHGLQPFYEALRDRLILFFELRNLTHKPKLVAVTSCASNAGVSSTAAGLAAALSETGDGNVLLVDMHLHGAAHQFYKGRLGCGLDDALENDKRSHALVQDNLYVVSESTNGDKLPRVLPKRFKHLVPRLKASDYDYIIFDLPPVTQISPTPRLARFMDMVFVVVESEKTDREVVKRATALLSESKPNLGIILNKARNYVPRQLQQEL